MKSSLRDRGTIFLIIIALLIVIGGAIYATSNSNDAAGEFTNAIKITDKSNEEGIKEFQKRGVHYAFKINEGEKQLLEIYTSSPSASQAGAYTKGVFDISKQDFESIELNKEYWLNIEYYEANKPDKGKIVKVYTENPHP